MTKVYYTIGKLRHRNQKHPEYDQQNVTLTKNHTFTFLNYMNYAMLFKYFRKYKNYLPTT